MFEIKQYFTGEGTQSKHNVWTQRLFTWWL